MASHYFTPAPPDEGRPARERTIRFTDGGREYRFRTAAGVFSRGAVDRGTRLLLEAVDPAGAGTILDLGSGYGALGIVMAARAPGARVTLVDINPRATALAAANIRDNAVANAEARTGDGCAPVGDARFDLILINPPIRAGRAVVLRLLGEAHARLAPGGRFYLVARTSQGARTLARCMGEVFGRVREVERGGGFRVYEGSGSAEAGAPASRAPVGEQRESEDANDV
ncbi:MAG TPA: class I SAM-dependent methyltransferase [bacterium]|nr:class I SAM-dependent methyltransferase [bacterium]